MKVLKNLSNIIGHSVNRKIVVFESDDWGSLRMPSAEVRLSLERDGLDLGKGKESYRYSLYDTLASTKDFENLFNNLTGFKDVKNNPPVFTALSLTSNPNFDKILSDNFSTYEFEPFTDTRSKFGDSKAFDYWKLGEKENLFIPEFHGREHLNVSAWMRRLNLGDLKTRIGFDSKVWAISLSDMRIDYQAAFDLELESDLKDQSVFINLFSEKPKCQNSKLY